MVRSTIMFASLSVVAALALPASAGIVANGNFELIDGGDPANAAGWTGENGSTIVRLPTGGVGGSAGALISNTNPASAAGPFSQFTAAAGGDAVVGGTTYTFSFDSNRTYANGGVFQALLFARNALDVPIGGPVLNVTLVNPTVGFENSSYSIVAPAGATQFSVEFFAITGAAIGSSSSVVLDNVSIVDPNAAAVPEPAALSVLGLGALGALRRSRRNRSV